MVNRFGLRWNSDEEPLFLHEVEQMQDPGAVVLDLGAGAGSFEYARYRARVIALDLEPVRLADPTRPYIRADASALPLRSGTLDLVVANFTFEHLHNPGQVLAEIQRTLKSQGLLYLAVPNSRSLEDRLFAWLGGGEHHVQSYSFASLLRAVYASTALKLVSFAYWPAGYTWLTGPFYGKWPRRALMRVLRRLRPLLISSARWDSGYVLLFRMETKSGFRRVTDVCASCGAGSTIDSHEAEWECLQCRAVHPRNPTSDRTLCR